MKVKMFFLIAGISMIIDLNISCIRDNMNNKTHSNIQSVKYKNVESFDSFYNKFHSDSIFQRSRIINHLDGLRFDGEREIYWTKDNQPYLVTKIYDVDTSEYKVSYNKTDSDFMEKVWIENSGFWSEYKFKLLNKKWYLVSAIEHNL